MKRLLFALVLASACNRASADATGTEPAPSTPPAAATRVETATLRASPAALRLTLPGEVQGVRDALLSAPLGGFIESVHVKAGQKVKRGQLLARVDTQTQVSRQRQAQIELDTAQREYDRAVKLADAIPRAEIDMAESRLDAARAAVGTGGVTLSRSVINAPFTGVVVNVDVEPGEVAAPGVPLIRVVQLDPVKVSVSLSDRDVVAMTEGMDATVRIEARSTPVKGKVTHIQPAADLRTRTFLADVEVDNRDRSLLPGMIASVELDVEVAKDQLVIAQDWLVTRLDDVGVFVVRGDAASWRKVVLGPIVRDRVVVASGLSPGDELVITGHRELQDGDRLLVARKGVCCTNGRVDFD